MNLFRRKSVTQLQAEALADDRLKRALGATNLTALGIGAIIGTGIFVLTGTVAAQNAGPAVVLSFVLAGVASIFAALCYSEFASLVPMAGSAYTYGYATLGELFAWIIGWDLILEYALGAVTVSIGWSGYVVSFLRDIGIHIPPELSAARGTLVTLADGTQVTAIFNLPAVIIIGIVTLLLVIGIRESANVNNVIVFVKLASVHPGEHRRARAFRLERRDAGRWDSVFRIHRFRRCQYGSARGKESPARHADRHHRLIVNLYRSVHRGVRHCDWYRPVPAVGRAGSDCRGRRPCRGGLDGLANQ